MLDKRFILENAELVQQNCDRRGVKVDVSRFVEIESQRRKLQAQFLRSQRMESIGTLAGGIAHDLNNVLAPVLLSIGMLREAGADEARGGDGGVGDDVG